MKKKSTRYFAVIPLFLFAVATHAQYLNIDSCLQVLKVSKEDTNRVILLSDIAWDISYQNLQKGADYAEQSILLARKLNAEQLYSRVFHVAGSIYFDMSEQGKALDFFLEGLKYSKKYAQVKQSGFIYNALGNFYNKQNKDLRRAITYYLQAVDAHKKSGSSQAIYIPYNNLGGAYLKIKKIDSAIYYLNLCKVYNAQEKNSSHLLYNYITLSEIYTDTKNKLKGLEFGNAAVALARELKDKYSLARALIQQGNAFYVNHQMPEAKKSLIECIALAKDIGDVTTLETATYFLSEVYESTGDYKNSLIYYKEFKSYTDSMLNSENFRQIRSAEARYENEKKQAEIVLLAEKQKLSEATQEKNKVYLYSAAAGIITLSVLLLMLFKNNRAKQKTNAALEQYNNEVKHQKELVEEKNKEITDSIHYAQRIQQSLLTSHGYFKKHTTDFFILFKPKDIVSGDFYWALQHNNQFMVMTADCTGHGVPGAMMSMMGINFINEIVNEKKITSPAAVLNQLKKEIIKALNPEGSIIEGKDGMDCSLCSFDFDNKKLTYANANNDFYILRDGAIINTQLNKMPVGAGHDFNASFQDFEFDLQKNDIVITFTDGYADQFGGPKGKKFKYKQLEKILIDNAHLSLHEIQKKLDESVETWRGQMAQVDDICIVGIKI